MNDQNTDSPFGEVIFSYTREQAIEDGELVDLSAICPEECRLFKYPVACTRAVWNTIEAACSDAKACNDLKGVVWDILHMARAYSNIPNGWGRGFLGSDDRASRFPVIIRSDRAHEAAAGCQRETGCLHEPEAGPDAYVYKMWLACGPGDDGEPVLTLMFMGED